MYLQAYGTSGGATDRLMQCTLPCASDELQTEEPAPSAGGKKEITPALPEHMSGKPSAESSMSGLSKSGQSSYFSLELDSFARTYFLAYWRGFTFLEPVLRNSQSCSRIVKKFTILIVFSSNKLFLECHLQCLLGQKDQSKPSAFGFIRWQSLIQLLSTNLKSLSLLLLQDVETALGEEWRHSKALFI